MVGGRTGARRNHAGLLRDTPSVSLPRVKIIQGSVGTNGRNARADVITVQELLNNHRTAIGLTVALGVTGNADQKTIDAIKLFQRKILGLNNPDGRVDPGGRTLKALNGGASAGSTNGRARPRFVPLWSGYPTVSSPCDQGYANQCAIRLSIALNAQGTLRVGTGSYSEPKCRHGHARGAQSLAYWLVSRLGRPQIFTNVAAGKRTLTTSQGIIFFKDCFTRAGETTQSGDHIDLWLRGLTKTFDDPANRSAQVWFWELP